MADVDLTREDLEPTVPRSRIQLPRFSPPNFSVNRFRSSMNGKRLTALILLLLLVAALIFVIVRNLPPNLHYARVSTGDIAVSFMTTGTLRSATYGANFVEPGRLAEIDVTVGQQVTQGQTLAKLDTKLLNDAVNTAQAAVNAAQTQLADAQTTQSNVQAQGDAAVSAAASQEQNAINGCKNKPSSQQAACIQAAEDAYAAVQAQANAQNAAAQQAVNTAQSSLSQAQANLQQAQDALSAATLTAGHSGTISAINAAVGDTVGGAGTSFITITDLGSMQVLANVNVAQVGGITQDTVFRLVVPSVGKQQFGGTLEGVSPIGQQSHGVLYYPVLIDVDMQSTNGANLLPGMTANVRVITQQRTGVLLIPASAVNFAQSAGNPKFGGFLPHSQVAAAQKKANQLLLDLQNSGAVSPDDNPTASYVLEYSNGKWTAKPVVLGLTDGQNYEVLAGLVLGEKVVTGQEGGSVTIPTPTPQITH